MQTTTTEARVILSDEDLGRMVFGIMQDEADFSFNAVEMEIFSFKRVWDGTKCEYINTICFREK